MENYSNSSYPDSGNSSPQSRESENALWEEPLSTNYKVKFMCSYGGKIHPRSHDNQLTYVGGDTKILAVDRSIRFSAFMAKLSSLCADPEVCCKYQLPEEDLDALISVTNDEDLEHMMLEFDRLYRVSAKPARLRLFLFPLNLPASFGTNETKSEKQWFVDALNSAVQIQSLQGSAPPPAEVNPDFLFGLDKGHAPPEAAAKLRDPTPPPTVPEVFTREIHAGSDSGSEDRHVIGDPVVSPLEIQRQMQDLQRLHISGHEQSVFHKKSDETNPGNYTGAYYAQQIPEKLPPPPQTAVPAAYMTAGGYTVAAPSPLSGPESPVYLIQTPAGVYQASGLPPVTGQVGQGYYGMQRVMPEVYREQPVYSTVPPQQSIQQQPKYGAYTEAVGMVPQPAGGGVGVAAGAYTEAVGMVPQPPGGGVGVAAQPMYAQVGYDGAGRQVYYTTTARGVVPPYQPVTATAVAVDVRQTGGALNQEGKVVAKAPQSSSM
ncbi:uncharacterized protein LOC132278764 [Cornus florida]|uniref:uncharacterized protein LOC132278764 n=1 Tax=Cornus florida TaxID=4283 RepID=UPI00289D5BF0|nr:uncharacterized protein LOC132278764 [Cornus florida]